MGQLTISMAIFKFAHCKRLPGRVPIFCINKPAWDFETSKKPWVSEKNSGIIAGFHAKPGPISLGLLKKFFTKNFQSSHGAQ